MMRYGLVVSALLGCCGCAVADPTVIMGDTEPNLPQAQVVLVAIDSYAVKDADGGKGYVRAFPDYGERALRDMYVKNPDTLSQVYIVLIGPQWSLEGYKKSDLKRYLATQSGFGTKVEEQMFLVPAQFPVKWKLRESLEKVIAMDGRVFLVDAGTPGDVQKLYNELVTRAPVGFQGNIYYNGQSLGDPLIDALKKFSASLGALGARVG